MPIYEYECTKCGHRFEVIQKISDSPVKKCEKCKGKTEKLISSPAIQFKGSGWYADGYSKNNSGTGSSESKDGESKDTSKSKDATAKQGASSESESKTPPKKPPKNKDKKAASGTSGSSK